MDDKERMEIWAACNDPIEGLNHLVENWEFIGTDPYYRDLNRALTDMASRCWKVAQGYKKVEEDKNTKALLLQLIKLQGTMLEVLTKVVSRLDDKKISAETVYCSLYQTWEQAEKYNCDCPPCKLRKEVKNAAEKREI